MSEGGPDRRPHVVVVGAGITGLAAAHALASAVPGEGRGVRVTMLEGGRTVGGKLRLGEVAGVQVDLGAEAILNRRPEGVALARSVGLADAVVHPATTSAAVWARGALRPLPPTLLGIPASIPLMRSSRVVDETGIRRAALERGFPPLDVTEDVAVGRLVSRRLGRQVRDLLVEPLLGGIYAGWSDELSLHATMPAVVAAVARHGGLLAAAEATVGAAVASGSSAAGPAPPVFAGLQGGVGRLAEEAAASARRLGVDVRTSSMVRSLERRAAGWRVVIGPANSPEAMEADAVVLACPAAPAARLLGDVAPEAAADLADIGYASMALVTLAFRLDSTESPLRGSGFLVPPVEGRTIKAATFSSVKWGWRSAAVAVVRCSIGRYHEEAQLQYDDAELVDMAAADLRAATGLRSAPVDAVVTRWGGALPQYAVGHLDRVRRIRERLSSLAGLEMCGAALDGVGIPACVASGEAAATRALTALTAAGVREGTMEG